MKRLHEHRRELANGGVETEACHQLATETMLNDLAKALEEANKKIESRDKDFLKLAVTVTRLEKVNTAQYDELTKMWQSVRKINELEKRQEIHHIMIDHLGKCVEPKDMDIEQIKRLQGLTNEEQI